MSSKNFMMISLARITVGNCGTEICDKFGSVSAQQCPGKWLASCHPFSDQTYLELPLCSAATSLPYHHKSTNSDGLSHHSVSLRPCSSSCCAQPTIPAFKHHCQHIRKCDVSSLLTNLRLLVADHHPPDRPRTSQSCQQHHVSRASVLSSKARIHCWVHWCPCRKLLSALQLL